MGRLLTKNRIKNSELRSEYERDMWNLYLIGDATKKDKLNTARQKRFDSFINRRSEFMAQLEKELNAINAEAVRQDTIDNIQLNNGSDVAWEVMFDNVARWTNIQFYDYTERVERAVSYKRGEFPVNYQLVFKQSLLNK